MSSSLPRALAAIESSSASDTILLTSQFFSSTLIRLPRVSRARRAARVLPRSIPETPSSLILHVPRDSLVAESPEGLAREIHLAGRDHPHRQDRDDIDERSYRDDEDEAPEAVHRHLVQEVHRYSHHGGRGHYLDHLEPRELPVHEPLGEGGHYRQVHHVGDHGRPGRPDETVLRDEDQVEPDVQQGAGHDRDEYHPGALLHEEGVGRYPGQVVTEDAERQGQDRARRRQVARRGQHVDDPDPQEVQPDRHGHEAYQQQARDAPEKVCRLGLPLALVGLHHDRGGSQLQGTEYQLSL